MCFFAMPFFGNIFSKITFCVHFWLLLCPNYFSLLLFGYFSLKYLLALFQYFPPSATLKVTYQYICKLEERGNLAASSMKESNWLSIKRVKQTQSPLISLTHFPIPPLPLPPHACSLGLSPHSLFQPTPTSLHIPSSQTSSPSSTCIFHPHPKVRSTSFSSYLPFLFQRIGPQADSFIELRCLFMYLSVRPLFM